MVTNDDESFLCKEELIKVMPLTHELPSLIGIGGFKMQRKLLWSILCFMSDQVISVKFTNLDCFFLLPQEQSFPPPRTKLLNKTLATFHARYWSNLYSIDSRSFDKSAVSAAGCPFTA